MNLPPKAKQKSWRKMVKRMTKFQLETKENPFKNILTNALEILPKLTPPTLTSSF